MSAVEELKIIPTFSRNKLPKRLSYPLNAKAISEALQDVPQYASLQLEFRFYSKRAQLHGTEKPYPVLAARYANLSRINLEWPNWTVQVEAVPRELRHFIGERLKEEALPKIRDWLRHNCHENDREGGHWLEFEFDEFKRELKPLEGASPDWHTYADHGR